MIVEDEPNIRGGLVRHSVWRELGVDRVLEADDGVSALERIREEPGIRLVLTDIRMKKMSGIEFIRELYDTLSFQGKVMILSGYDDFQYARAAMAYGVVDYLLKPVDMAELAQVAGRAIARLEEEDRQFESLRLMEHAMPKLKEELLQRTVEAPSGGEPSAQLCKELQTHDLIWLTTGPLVLMVLEADNLRVASSREQAADPGLVSFAIGNVLEYSLYEYARTTGPYVRFRSARHDRWIVVFGESPGGSRDARIRLDEWEPVLRSRMRTYVKVGVSIAFVEGEENETPGVLYRKALERLERIRLYGSGEEEDAEAFREVDMLSGAQALVDLLKHGDAGDVSEATAQFPLLVREWNVGKLRDLHHRAFEWLLDVFEAARKSGWKEERWRRNPLELWERVQAYDTVEALHAFVAGELLQVNEELRGTPRNQVLLAAERYIRDHFTEPLTVQAIAEQAYVTPEWLSTLFKKHHGSTVLDYITRLRMEKAKELLQDVGLKVYQIGGLVGYRDAVYFSRLFRRTTGLTPKEYRNQKGIRTDE
nr:helix-turn-helix domain-containing protein [Cohnella sp. REN36]